MDGLRAIHAPSELRAVPLPDGTLATLQDAVQLLRGYAAGRCGLMFNLKTPGLEEPILELFQHTGFSDVVVCGYYGETLRAIKVARPDLGYR